MAEPAIFGFYSCLKHDRLPAAAGLKTVVLTHFVPADDKSITDAMWTDGVRKHVSGRIIVGRT